MSPELLVQGEPKPVTVVTAVIEALAELGAVEPVTQKQLMIALKMVKEEHSKISQDYGYDKR